MKKQMLKLTMLLLAIVFGGSSALAQTVIFERKSASAWTSEDVTDWGTSNLKIDTSNGLCLTGAKDVVVNGKKVGETTCAKKAFSFKSGSVVSLEAYIKIGTDSGNSTSYDYFSFGGVTLRVYRWKDSNKVEYGSYKLVVNDGVEQSLGTTVPTSTNHTIKFVVNQTTGEVQYTLLKGSDVIATGTVNTTASLSEVKFGHETKDGANKASNIYLKTLKISEEPAASSSIDLSLNNSYTYSTFCSTESDVDFTNVKDVEAYQATVNNNVVSLTKVTGKVKAGEGLLIKNVGKVESVSIPTTTGATALVGNKLVGVTKALTVTEFADKTAYILASDTEFQLITSATTGTFAVGKAYLDCTAEAGAKPSILFFGEATGINGVAVEKKADNAIYNLQGMRVKTPTKGLYIINGKKYRF